MTIVLSTLDPEKIYPDQKNFDRGNAKLINLYMIH